MICMVQLLFFEATFEILRCRDCFRHEKCVAEGVVREKERKKRGRKKMPKYMVSVKCSWVEEVSAKSMEEAVRKAEKKYRDGQGHFPREYLEVSPEAVDWSEVE